VSPATSLLLLTLITLPLACAVAGQPDTVVRPADTGEALANPGMGWVFHYYDNVPAHYGSRLAPSDTLDDYPGLTVIYLRIPWSYIEPEEGTFRWSVLDSPAQRWLPKGKQIALRISCSESWMRYATPQWVEKAGARGYNFRPGKGVVEDGPLWEPDFDDPVFLAKLDAFLAALARRYDGSPDVAFIDVGSFGVWGEGHTYHSTRRPYSQKTLQTHIDLHLKHFKKTLLAANDDFASHGRGDGIIDYARAKGLTLRDDSILVQPGKRAYFHAAMAQPFWPHVPVVLESEHYGGSRDRGNWQDGRLYLQAVEDYHASYASIHWWPREFLRENRDLIRRMNLRLGYRIQLVEAAWPTSLPLGSPFRFAAQWRNAGVAPCLPGGHPIITLKDAKGGTASVFVDREFDVRSLPVGEPGKAQARAHSAAFDLPFYLPAGAYTVCISIGTQTGTPRIALPLPHGDGQRRYPLGTLTVTADYDVRVGAIRKQDDGWLLPATWTIRHPLPEGVKPFCHFDRGGKIVFQGHPDPSVDLAALEKPGTVELGCIFTVPADARGQAYSVHIGLWQPNRLGKPDERLRPDRGAQDRRVAVGRLQVAADGTAAFKP